VYSPIADQRLRVMTAAEGCQIPTLDVVRQLPIIQMSLAEIYRSSEKSRASAHDVLRESAIPQPKCCPDFGRKLPKIITGEDESWQLWRVDFYVARLQLYYIESAVRSEGYHLTGGTALDSIGHFRSCAAAYLVSPVALGLNFDLPELDWHISYDMNCSSKNGSHSVRFVETFGGAPSGNFDYSVPSVESFQPEAPYWL